MVQNIANVNGVKTFVSGQVSENHEWESLLEKLFDRLVQPKLSNIQNDFFFIHSFLLERTKFSYRQLIQFGTNMMKSY